MGLIRANYGSELGITMEPSEEGSNRGEEKKDV